MTYISVDIQFKDLKFDIHMQDIFVLVVKRFEVVCTSNLATAHNLMSLGYICSPLIQNRVNITKDSFLINSNCTFMTHIAKN